MRMRVLRYLQMRGCGSVYARSQPYPLAEGQRG